MIRAKVQAQYRQRHGAGGSSSRHRCGGELGPQQHTGKMYGAKVLARYERHPTDRTSTEHLGFEKEPLKSMTSRLSIVVHEDALIVDIVRMELIT